MRETPHVRRQIFMLNYDCMKENNIPQTGAAVSGELERQTNPSAIKPDGEQLKSCPRILVVEDDRVQRQTNAMALAFTGYTVDVAEDGAAAWEALQASCYDLLITDNHMPKLTGIELLKDMRSAGMKLPVIMATGKLPTQELAQNPWLEPVALLVKPYAAGQLLEKVKVILHAEPANISPPRVAPKQGDAGAFSVEQYTAADKPEWDRFVGTAKNATFLFARDYMDYHSDRFTDHSLMVFKDHELVAVLPANLRADGTLVSHEGLTYGGLVVACPATMENVLACFYVILRHLNQGGISKFIYKRIPGFYNTFPDDDVAYALFMLDAKLQRRDCSATVIQANRLPFRRGHKYLIKKAARHEVRMVLETSFQPFWEQVLTPQLATRYAAKPVHTLEEITLLASRFPEQIKQFSAYCGDEIVAGTTIYETPTVAHAQYGAVTEKGRQIGAQAFLFSSLIELYKGKRFFDFGISNEHEGRVLNHGLLEWKEGFGARCYAHDFYEIATWNYLKLEPVLKVRPETSSPPETSRSLPSTEGNGMTRGYFAHPKALIDDGVSIGRGTRIWAFAHVAAGAVLGEDCNVCDHTFIEGGVRIGNRVTVKCGVYLWEGVTLEDDVFIGPGAVFTNDVRPRSKKYLKQPLPTVLKEGCSLGAGSIMLPNLTIGRWAMVGAGAVVTHSVPDFALVVGNPARLHAWICRCGEKLFPADGRFMDCKCGLRYERIAEYEVKQLAADGDRRTLPANGIGPTIKNNGYETNNGQ
jgi:acetyltransferase-like isoleucine patch superfamily enzyme/CheY-like chemotaxis protein